MRAAPPLRRVDWRFLLPAPAGGRFRRLVLLGGPAGLAKRVVETGMADEVVTTLPRDRSADAVAMLAGARTGIREASACLAGDGVVYWEIDRRTFGRVGGHPGRISRQLRKAGLEPAASYWVTPSFDDAKQYLPLDAAEPIEWFFRTRFVAGTVADLALRAAVRALGPAAPKALRVAVPCYAITATMASRGPQGPSILAGVSHRALARGEAHAAVFTSGRDDGSRLVALPLVPGAADPDIVLKCARLGEFVLHTEREQAGLAELRALLGPQLRSSLPEPLGPAGAPAGPVFLETAVRGRMLAASVARWGAPVRAQVRDLRAAAEWLAAFHREAIVHERTWSAEDVGRWVDRPTARYAEVFRATEPEARLFSLAAGRARAMAGTRMPIVWAHNDFAPWHVYRDGERVGVIDWELGDGPAAREGLPLCDLVYFVSHWLNLTCRDAAGEAAQVRAFVDFAVGPPADNPRHAAAREVVSEYMRDVGVHPGFYPVLLLCTWVQRALDHESRRRLLAPAAAPDGSRTGNRFAGYVEALAGRADRLFAGFGTADGAP